MADPTRTEIITQLKNSIKILEETRLFAESNTQNWVNLQDIMVQSLETNFIGGMGSGIDSLRSGLNAVLNGGTQLVDPSILEFGRLIKAPETDPISILGRMYDDFIDNSDTIKTRAFSFGTSAPAMGNVGNGSLLRLNLDENAELIESQFADAKVATCISDQNSGSTKHEELFEFRGATPGTDSLRREGSGLVGSINVSSPRQSDVSNASFDRFAGTAAVPTDITNWTSNVTVNSTNYTFDTTNVYLPAVKSTDTPAALNVKVSAQLSQRIDLTGVQIDPGTPYIMQIAYNRAVGSASGTLVIRMGATSATVAVSAQTGWNVLRLTIDENLWLKAFNEDNLDIRVEWTRTGGELLVDDMIFTTMTEFDNSWYALMPGQTPFLRDDQFTWTDTETGSVIQRWLWRLYGAYLPSSASPTITDP